MNNDTFIAYSPRIIKNEIELSRAGLAAYLCLDIKLNALSQPTRVYIGALPNQRFSIGRGTNNDITIADIAISRQHIYLIHESDHWFIEDNNSLNGCFINNTRLSGKQALTLPCEINFGRSETILSLSLLTFDQQAKENNTLNNNDDRTQIIPPLNSTYSTPPNHEKPALHDKPQDSLLTEGEFKQSFNAVKKQYTEQVNDNNTAQSTQQSLNRDEIQEKLFSKKAAEDAGEYTQILRSMIHKDRKKKSRVYQYSLFFLVLLLSAVVAFAVYQQRILDNARTLALDMFYDIKDMEISLAQLELKLQNDLTNTVDENSVDSQASYEVQKAQQALREAQQAEADIKRKKLQVMQEKYQTYLKKLESIKISRIKPPLISARQSHASDYEKQLILDVAIKFGESELELPDEFYDKVHEYIVYWQSSSRLPRAMQHLANKNYAPIIKDALRKQNLPEQFLYLVLQESNFNTQAIGPETRYGIAKGAWQFLPGTGRDFGLAPGAKADIREYDGSDERFHFDKASYAGAKYLKHIYSTEAQASGLLVMAGYNYGHNRVKGMIRKMPNNPRERNFWQFIQKYKIPKETYDYVFYIFSAAVIAEDPKYFGFSFRSPTAGKKE